MCVGGREIKEREKSEPKDIHEHTHTDIYTHTQKHIHTQKNTYTHKQKHTHSTHTKKQISVVPGSALVKLRKGGDVGV